MDTSLFAPSPLYLIAAALIVWLIARELRDPFKQQHHAWWWRLHHHVGRHHHHHST